MRPVRVAAFAIALASAVACSSASPETIGTDHSADTASLGFCRTTTCQRVLAGDYPTADRCEPADFSESPECKATSSSNAPLWWKPSCTGYDLNAAGGRDVPYDVLAKSVTAAFAAWTEASCAGGGHPSIAVADLGAVTCAKAAYDEVQPNQNVIVFHDDAWPHEKQDRAAAHTSKSQVIALTTVTYGTETGEIFDADVELNSADYHIVPLADGAAPDRDTYDLQTVLTHELGHYFGIAHSPGSAPVMNASADVGGSETKRTLRDEDTLAICSIYPPGGARWVSALVDPSEHVAAEACDPTPRNGFASDCPY